jgi:hypothetical protein
MSDSSSIAEAFSSQPSGQVFHSDLRSRSAGEDDRHPVHRYSDFSKESVQAPVNVVGIMIAGADERECPWALTKGVVHREAQQASAGRAAQEPSARNSIDHHTWS